MLKFFIVQYITAGSSKDPLRMSELASNTSARLRRRVAENPYVRDRTGRTWEYLFKGKKRVSLMPSTA